MSTLRKWKTTRHHGLEVSRRVRQPNPEATAGGGGCLEFHQFELRPFAQGAYCRVEKRTETNLSLVRGVANHSMAYVGIPKAGGKEQSEWGRHSREGPEPLKNAALEVQY